MKRATTIIRQIDELEKELYTNYSFKEIWESFEKEEKKKRFWGGSDGLVSVIATLALEMKDIYEKGE